MVYSWSIIDHFEGDHIFVMAHTVTPFNICLVAAGAAVGAVSSRSPGSSLKLRLDMGSTPDRSTTVGIVHNQLVSQSLEFLKFPVLIVVLCPETLVLKLWIPGACISQV